MAQASRMKVLASTALPNKDTCKDDIQRQMKLLANRMRSLSTASMLIKEPEDQQQVAMYISELRQKVLTLRKQL